MGRARRGPSKSGPRLRGFGLRVAEFFQFPSKARDWCERLRAEHADTPMPPGLLRLRPERPERPRASNTGDELPPLHSMTSSARARSVGGIVRPSAFAV